MENAEMMRPAYAIEYLCVDPTVLELSLEVKGIEGLFLAVKSMDRRDTRRRRHKAYSRHKRRRKPSKYRCPYHIVIWRQIFTVFCVTDLIFETSTPTKSPRLRTL